MSSRTDTIKSLFDFALNVSFESAVIINAPPAVEFTTNCLRKVTDVTDVLALLSVFSVLILFFLSFLRRRFLFWSCSATRFLVAGTVVVAAPGATETSRVSSSVIDATILSPTLGILITSPTRSSETNLVPKPETTVPEPAVEIVPLKENVESRTVSAVKSSAATFASSMKTCFTLSKVFVTTAETVKSAFELSSRISSVSCDEEEMIFSPVLKEPTTLISSNMLLTAL